MLVNTKSHEITKQYAYHERPSITLIAYATRLCNFKCSYCADFLKSGDDFLDLEVLEHYIKSMHAQTQKAVDVVLIGGEPTLNPQVPQFCQQFKDNKNVSIEIVTNFSKPASYYNSILESNAMTRLVLSWHGNDKDGKNDDYIRKLDDLDQRFILDERVDIRIMAEKDNYANSREAFTRVFPKYKKYIEFLALHDRKCQMDQYSHEQKLDIAKLCKMTQNEEKSFFIEENGKTKKSVSFNDLYLNPTIQYTGWNCYAGVEYVYVHSNGNVYNCQSYYEHNLSPLYNIYSSDGGYLSEKHSPCVCKVDYCTYDFDVRKEKIPSK